MGWEEEAGLGTGPLPEGAAAKANPGHLHGGGRKWVWDGGVGTVWPSWIGKQLELRLSALLGAATGDRGPTLSHSLLESKAMLEKVP